MAERIPLLLMLLATVCMGCNPLGGDSSLASSYTPGLPSSSSSSLSPLSSPAGPANIYYGLQAYDANGNLMTGTMPLGSGIIGTNASLSVTVAKGYYSGSQTATCADANLAAANIVTGVSIFGTAGTAGSGFSYFSDSTANHSAIATGAKTAEQEYDNGTCSNASYTGRTACEAAAATWTPTLMTNYRNVSDITIDTDSGGGTSVNRTGWGATTCGTSQNSIAARIANCAANGTIGPNATWDGTKLGISGAGMWKLVTRKGNQQEVWQDQKTLLLWSTLVATGVNWCVAAGNYQSNDPNSYCNNGAYQNQTTPTSYCAEDAGLSPAIAGEVWTAGSASYSSKKGGMGLNSTPSVLWRLPTRGDQMQAEIDGIRWVINDFAAGGNLEWDTTINSYAGNSSTAYGLNSATGAITTATRSSTASNEVRCVGR